MRNAGKLALVLVLAAASLTATASPAAAAAESTVKVTKAVGDIDGVSVSGTVSSPKGGCEKNRVVKVFHDVAPPNRDFKLGTARTNNNGHWHLDSDEYPDKVYAKVRGTEDCKRDKSPTETVKYS
jgi:hypothetical protein